MVVFSKQTNAVEVQGQRIPRVVEVQGQRIPRVVCIGFVAEKEKDERLPAVDGPGVDSVLAAPLFQVRMGIREPG